MNFTLILRKNYDKQTEYDFRIPNLYYNAYETSN